MENFSEESKRVLKQASEYALNLNSELLAPEHIFLALYDLGENDLATTFLVKKGIEKKLVIKNIKMIESPKLLFPFIQISLSPNTKTLLDIAKNEAMTLAEELVQPKHLLLALLKIEDSWAYKIIQNLGYFPRDLYDSFKKNGERKTAFP